MSDPTPAAETPAGEAARPSFGLRLLGGCLVVLLVAVGAIVLLNLSARGRLDARVAALRTELAQLRAAEDAERPTHFGERVEGNAVDHYHALQWVLGPGSHERWQEPPEGMVETELGRDHLGLSGTDMSQVWSAWRRTVQEGQPVDPLLQAHLDTYGGLTRHVREGLQRTRCQWPFRYEEGALAEIPNLLTMRHAASLMWLQARRSDDPGEAVRLGLEMIAFGNDLARHPTLIGAMIGVAVRGLGAECLAQTLAERELSPGHYTEVVRVLGEVPRLDLARAWRSERICMGVTLAALSGRRLDGTPEGAERISSLTGETDPSEYVLGLSWVADREWAAYDGFLQRITAACQLPSAARRQESAAIEAEVESSSFLLASIAVPNLTRSGEVVDAAQVKVEAVRVLAAAHLHRLAHGAFPGELGLLKAALDGELPADPFREGTPSLTLAQVDGELRVYSWGENAADDGGTFADERDVGFATRAPK